MNDENATGVRDVLTDDELAMITGGDGGNMNGDISINSSRS